MGLLLQVVIAGLAAGAIYGLVAIGFTTVYRLTNVLNFAHGDFLGASVFLALALAAGTGPVTATSVPAWRYAIAVAAAVAVAGAAGALFYQFVVRPFFLRRSSLGWIGATVATALTLQGILAIAFRRDAYVFPDPLPFSRVAPLSLGGGASIEIRTLWLLAAGTVLALGAAATLRTKRFGRAVSAIASDPEGAQYAGLPVDRLVAIAFAFAAVLAALGGLASAPTLGAVTVTSGLVLGLKGIAASLLAGLRSPARAFGAALALGVVEQAVTYVHVPGRADLVLGPAWRDVAPLLLVLVVLAVRPGRGAEEPVE